MLHRRNPSRDRTRQNNIRSSSSAHPASGESFELSAHLTRRHPRRRQHVTNPQLSSATQDSQTVTATHSHQCTRPPLYRAPNSQPPSPPGTETQRGAGPAPYAFVHRCIPQKRGDGVS